jgi:hypothetical protein
MRTVKTLALVAVCVLGVAVILSAGPNKLGVANTQLVSFDEPIHVGNVLLPKGQYQITHTMEGENHIMVFKQQRVKNPAEARVKCTLVPLTAKAERNETFYTHDAANQHVLVEMTFKGDTAKHVF